MDDRFVVREIEGWLAPSEGSARAPSGLSVHVLDRAFGFKCVATFRTETERRQDSRGRRVSPISVVERHELVRERARERADYLNAAHEREVERSSIGTAA